MVKKSAAKERVLFFFVTKFVKEMRRKKDDAHILKLVGSSTRLT